jgi:hypothetical protein
MTAVLPGNVLVRRIRAAVLNAYGLVVLDEVRARGRRDGRSVIVEVDERAHLFGVPFGVVVWKWNSVMSHPSFASTPVTSRRSIGVAVVEIDHRDIIDPCDGDCVAGAAEPGDGNVAAWRGIGAIRREGGRVPRCTRQFDACDVHGVGRVPS